MMQSLKALHQGAISMKREIILFVFQCVSLYPELTFYWKLYLSNST